MLTTEQLLGLFAMTFHGRSRDSIPTMRSVARINRELGIVLPSSFVEFAERCPGYTILFGSIGEDFDCGHHILNVNRLFHGDDPDCSVPKWFVMFNLGHDGDCEGFDSRKPGADGEYPVLYWDAGEGVTFDNARWPVYSRFHDYLEFTLTYYARTADKESAEKIIHSA
jgi:hypothetical protein